MFGGSGANRTVTITPVSGPDGHATTITLTVTDGGGLTAASTFVSDGEPAAERSPDQSTVANQTSDDQVNRPAGYQLSLWVTPRHRWVLMCRAHPRRTDIVIEENYQVLSPRRALCLADRVEISDGDDHAGERSDGHRPLPLTVTDGGGLTSTSTFVVTVNPPPNTATISTVVNQTVTTGQSTEEMRWRSR